MTTDADTYREAGHRLLEQARVELEAGDLVQASEKAWGAAAQMVKAAAQANGWSHGSHRDLFVAVRDLTNQSGDIEIHDLFAYANYLHTNFYEGSFDAAVVARYLERVREFVAKLNALLEIG